MPSLSISISVGLFIIKVARCSMLSIHSPNRSCFPLLLGRMYWGRYSDSFPSMFSSLPSEFSSVRILRLWTISFWSRAANLTSMSSSSSVYKVSEPSFELWNNPNLGISLPCLSYQGLDLELISIIPLQSEKCP